MLEVCVCGRCRFFSSEVVFVVCFLLIGEGEGRHISFLIGAYGGLLLFLVHFYFSIGFVFLSSWVGGVFRIVSLGVGRWYLFGLVLLYED